MLGEESNERCSEAGECEKPKAKRELQPHVLAMLKVVGLWDTMIYKLDPQDRKFLANRCKYLMEKHGLTLDQILTAVANYGRSEWHISTGAWKKPIAFLTSDNIRKWQKTNEEQNMDRLNSYKRITDVTKANSLDRILARYKDGGDA